MSTSLMAGKMKRDPRAIAIAKTILEQYNYKIAKDMEDAIQEMLQGGNGFPPGI